MNNITNKIKDYVIISAALLLSATCYNVFLLPLNIVSGGSGGVATITKYAFNIDQAIMIFIVQMICLILCLLVLGKDKATKTLYLSLAYPLFVRITEFISDIIEFNTDDLFIVAIFAAVLSGIASGLIYKQGYNSGGFSVISQIMFEKFNISVAKTSLFLNTIIIAIASYYFGPTKAMYAIIYLYASNFITDRVLLGVSRNKAFYIVTSESEKVSDYIINTLGHNITYFDVKGGFLEKKKNVLLTVIPTREYYRVTEGIKMIDEDAFFVATDSYEARGAN